MKLFFANVCFDSAMNMESLASFLAVFSNMFVPRPTLSQTPIILRELSIGRDENSISKGILMLSMNSDLSILTTCLLRLLHSFTFDSCSCVMCLISFGSLDVNGKMRFVSSTCCVSKIDSLQRGKSPTRIEKRADPRTEPSLRDSRVCSVRRRQLTVNLDSEVTVQKITAQP